MHVAVVGSLNWDLTLRVDRLPQRGETVSGHDLAQGAGGKGLNQAVASARAGAPTSMVGRVGSDAHGNALVALLSSEGVDVAHVGRDDERSSGMAWIAVEPGGHNQIVVAPLANAYLGPADVEHALGAVLGERSGGVVLVQAEIADDAIEAALRGGRAAGARTVFNPSPARPLVDGWLRLVDYLVPNEHELAALAGVPAGGGGLDREGLVAVAGAMVAGGCGAVVVTRGAAGALLVDAAGAVDLAPFAVDDVQDTTGAGDAFCGAFAAALAAGADRHEALRRASATGALAVRRAGASAAMPTEAEVDALLARDLGPTL